MQSKGGKDLIEKFLGSESNARLVTSFPFIDSFCPSLTSLLPSFFSLFLGLAFLRRDALELKGGIALGPFVSSHGQLTSSRAIVGGILVESLAYKRNFRRNNFTVPTKKGFAVVESFVIRKGGELYANLRYLRKSRASESFNLCPSIQKFAIDPNTEATFVGEIIGGPLMTISRNGDLFLVDLPFSNEAN